MLEIKRRFLCTVILTGLTAAAYSQDSPAFHSKLGFSFVPPPGWVVASKGQLDVMNRETRKLLANLGDLDFDRIAVVAFDPTEDEFTESMNIVVSPGRLPLEEPLVGNKVAQALNTQFVQAGAVVRDLAAEVTTVGRHDCVRVDSQLRIQGVELRQWQVMIPGTRQTYIVTCTSTVEAFDSFEPLFSRSLASLEIDLGWSGVPKWIINALIGAALGALFGLGTWFFGRAPKTTTDEDSTTPTTISE